MEKLKNVLERLGTTEDTTPAVKREEGGKNPTGPLFYFVDGIDCRTALAD